MNTSDVHILGLQPQFLIFPWIFLIASIIAIPLIVLWAFIYRNTSHGYSDNFPTRGWVIGIVGWIAMFVVVVSGLGWAFSPIPYNAKYWPYYSVSGTITHVSNGFSDGSGDTTQRVYVVTLAGDPRPYQLEDARVTTLLHQKVGLTCTLDWVDAGNSADQWECNIRTADFTSEGQ